MNDYAAAGILVTTDLLVYWMDEYEAEVSNVHLLVEMKPTDKLSGFISKCVQERIEGDKSKNVTQSANAKNKMNSCYD